MTEIADSHRLTAAIDPLVNIRRLESLKPEEKFQFQDHLWFAPEHGFPWELWRQGNEGGTASAANDISALFIFRRHPPLISHVLK